MQPRRRQGGFAEGAREGIVDDGVIQRGQRRDRDARGRRSRCVLPVIGRRAARGRACRSALRGKRSRWTPQTRFRRRFSIAVVLSEGQPRRPGASARHRSSIVRVGCRVPLRPRAGMDPRARHDTATRYARGRGTATADAPLVPPTPSSSHLTLLFTSAADESPSETRAFDGVTRTSPPETAQSRRLTYRASRWVARRLVTGASGCASRDLPTLAFAEEYSGFRGGCSPTWPGNSRTHVDRA